MYYRTKEGNIINSDTEIENVAASNDLFRLLDRYVLRPIKRGTRIKIFRKMDFVKLSKDYVIRYHEFFRGAIWTEWGLKYVSVINEKGEDVLL